MASATPGAIGAGFAVLGVTLAGCGPRRDAAAVGGAIDAFHRAASAADFRAYFDALTEDAVFLGTDATERWTRPEFEAYARPHFEAGRGWTYEPRDRHIAFSSDGRTAWFDELLDNAKYGEARGTGVLVLQDGTWRITHYALTFPVPNAVAEEVVGIIRGRKDAD